jgi:hypothetical protein
VTISHCKKKSKRDEFLCCNISLVINVTKVNKANGLFQNIGPGIIAVGSGAVLVRSVVKF